MKIPDETTQNFYAEECIKSVWSVRKPDRQIRIDEFQCQMTGMRNECKLQWKFYPSNSEIFKKLTKRRISVIIFITSPTGFCLCKHTCGRSVSRSNLFTSAFYCDESF
jgi:predicted nuclease of restriction endonuclease-like (RecB) superfamily